MKRTALFLAMCVMSLTVSSSAVVAQDGWTTLFDGSSLKGWNVVGDANWEVVDKALQANKGTGFLVTPMAYGDFQFTAEFWVTDDANSGVFIRCEDPKTINAMNSYEVNIFDKRPDQSYRTGGIVDVAKPASVVMTGGKWNTFDITAQGHEADRPAQRHEDGGRGRQEARRGPIALQYGAGTVKFRNVRVRTL